MSLKAMETIGRYRMLPEGSKVIAAVSGGADSTAMLHFLCGIRKERSITVFAAHLNHGLRGKEAQRDEDFCAELCRRFGVKLFIGHADVASEAAANGETVEQAGRRVRYAFLERAARENDARLATAHTLSDSIETMMINLVRGTGLKGMCGIPPVRGNIIRPLIQDTRREIEAYCQENGLSYIFDSTNGQKQFTRNRLRLDVIPVLYEINPSFDKTAARALQNLTMDEAFLSGYAGRSLRAAEAGGDGYDAASLASLEPPIFARAAALAALETTGREPEAKHIESIFDMIKKDCGSVQLSGGWRAAVRNGRLLFESAESFKDKPAQEPWPETPFCEGIFDHGCYRVTVEAVNQDEISNNLKNIHKQYFNYMIDCDKIKGNAVIRSRRAGDKLRPAGRGVTKTLKKWMNETAVPEELRIIVPVAADEEGVLWTAGIGADERCAASFGATRVLAVRAEIIRGSGKC